MKRRDEAKIFASTLCPAEPRELWAILDAYLALAIDAVELGTCELAHDASLAARLARLPFSYLVHGNFPPPAFAVNVASPDPDLAERSLRHVLASIELSAELGAQLCSIHPGFVADPVGYSESIGWILPACSASDVRRAEDRLARAVEIASGRAEELGVGLLVENGDGTEDNLGKVLLASADDIGRLFDRVGGVGLLLDTGHLRVTATTIGVDPTDLVNDLMPLIAGVHVSENDGIVDTHDPVVEGSWTFELLERPDLARLPVTVEARLPRPADVLDHVEWLARSLRRDS